MQKPKPERAELLSRIEYASESLMENLKKYPNWGDDPDDILGIIELGDANRRIARARSRLHHFFQHIIYKERKGRASLRDLKDLFEELGIPKTAKQEEIEQLASKFMHQNHPDKYADSGRAEQERRGQIFSEQLNAWRLMCDPLLRDRYTYTLDKRSRNTEKYYQYHQYNPGPLVPFKHFKGFLLLLEEAGFKFQEADTAKIDVVVSDSNSRIEADETHIVRIDKPKKPEPPMQALPEVEPKVPETAQKPVLEAKPKAPAKPAPPEPASSEPSDKPKKPTPPEELPVKKNTPAVPKPEPIPTKPSAPEPEYEPEKVESFKAPNPVVDKKQMSLLGKVGIAAVVVVAGFKVKNIISNLEFPGVEEVEIVPFEPPQPPPQKEVQGGSREERMSGEEKADKAERRAITAQVEQDLQIMKDNNYPTKAKELEKTWLEIVESKDLERMRTFRKNLEGISAPAKEIQAAKEAKLEVQKDKEREELISKVESQLWMLEQDNFHSEKGKALKNDWNTLLRENDEENLKEFALHVEKELEKAKAENAKRNQATNTDAIVDATTDSKRSVNDGLGKAQSTKKKRAGENSPKEVELSEEPVEEVEAADGDPKEVLAPDELSYKASEWELIAGQTGCPIQDAWRSWHQDDDVVAGFVLVCENNEVDSLCDFSMSKYDDPKLRKIIRSDTPFSLIKAPYDLTVKKEQVVCSEFGDGVYKLDIEYK